MTHVLAPRDTSYQAFKPASQKQLDIIKSTIIEIGKADRELGLALWTTADEAEKAGKLTGGWGGGASTMIDSLFTIKAGLKAPAQVLAPELAEVTEGRYAIKGQDGSIDFYQVDRPTQGKWAGNTYVKLLVGSPGAYQEVRVRNYQAILAKIQTMGVEASARLFGQTTKHCGHCSAPLSTPQSRCSGYGQTCAEKHGYWYATKAEGLAWDAANLEAAL